MAALPVFRESVLRRWLKRLLAALCGYSQCPSCDHYAVRWLGGYPAHPTLEPSARFQCFHCGFRPLNNTAELTPRTNMSNNLTPSELKLLEERLVGHAVAPLTLAQRALLNKHGWPSDFAAACNKAADQLEITTAEADAAIAKYRLEWEMAGADPNQVTAMQPLADEMRERLAGTNKEAEMLR